jgi:TetR/AcrR family transcriptional regulator, transcriptional repressor for nem operon
LSDKRIEIMDAAEMRIRSAGYSGFSFRDLASDVGVKSSSIHYYFRTKEELGVAVARRYANRFFDALQEGTGERVQKLTAAFAQAVQVDGRVCLCGALGAASGSLPSAVACEAKSFFERALLFLLADAKTATASRQDRDWAFQILALLEGGMMLALILGDLGSFRGATKSLPPRPSSQRKRNSVSRISQSH